jgi:hypothetical protein
MSTRLRSQVNRHFAAVEAIEKVDVIEEEEEKRERVGGVDP